VTCDVLGSDRITAHCMELDCEEIADPAHVVEDRTLVQIFCRKHCPVHRDVEHFVGALRETVGIQERLLTEATRP
jgi:hypothetical protein